MKNIGIALLILTFPLASGCAGGNAIEQGVPQAAFAGAAVPLPPPARPDTVPEAAAGAPASTAAASDPGAVFLGSGLPRSTGAYPNINEEPQGATRQLTDEERDLLVARMQALASAHAQGKVSAAEYERRLAVLRKLAETHSNETILEIEQ